MPIVFQIIILLLVIFFCFIFIQWNNARREDKLRGWELKKDSQKIISPIRMRAYERLALLLERTQPEALLLNIDDITLLSIPQTQALLLKIIRTEFDHNMSQQIYVSDELWTLILQTRDDIAAFISGIAIQLPPDSTSLTYAQALIRAYASNGITTHERTIEFLKDEVKQLL